MLNKDNFFKEETIQKFTKEQMMKIQGGGYEAWPVKWRVSSDENGGG